MLKARPQPVLELPSEQQRSKGTEHTAQERLVENERLVEDEGILEEERVAKEECVLEEESVPQAGMPEQQDPTKSKLEG